MSETDLVNTLDKSPSPCRITCDEPVWGFYHWLVTCDRYVCFNVDNSACLYQSAENWSELKEIIDLQAGEAGTSELPSWSRPEAVRETDPWFAGLKKKLFLIVFFRYFVWALVERLISGGALRALQWQLHSASDQTHCALVVCNSEWMTVACSA